VAAEESLLSWISQVRRKELTAISEWLCDPSVIRQTERFEFTDLTNVHHEIRTELSDDIWPLKVPTEKDKGLVVLGFMRRGIPLQHTEVSLFRAGDEYRLTRLKSEDTENLALVLLDNVWRQCGQNELKSNERLKEEEQAGVLLEPTIPRPFEMPDNARFGAVDGKQKYASRFWREFLGIGNRNVNADWLLLHSRFKLRESEIANELFRHPRQDQPKWSVERALLAKLAARLAFSYIAAAWVPPDACKPKGPTEIRFKFQERVLSPGEQNLRIKALKRRGKKAWERTLAQAPETARSHEELQTDGARIRSTPETYLGLLDPALDDPDDHGPMPAPYEAAPSSWLKAFVTPPFRKSTYRLRGLCYWGKESLISLLGFLQDNSGRLIARSIGLVLVVWLALNAWHVLAFNLPPEHSSWPAGEEWPDGITLGFLVVLTIPLSLTLFLAAANAAYQFFGSQTKQSRSSDGDALIACLWASLSVGACLSGVAVLALILGHQDSESSLTGLARSAVEVSEDSLLGFLFAFLAAGSVSWLISNRLSIERRKTVVVPTWNGGRTAPIHEVITPKEFSVWQGILVRPSNRGRSWKTRPAVELGRKASFWWQDPSDRGHVPGFVPGRPHLMIMELRARLSRDLTLLGSILCFIAAILLAGPAFIQLNDPSLWPQLQSTGADALITILLLLPTAGGALLVRPGEDPIAASLLRADRLAVGIGAVLVSALGAGSILMLGWPEDENLPNAFWVAWLVLGSVALCFGLALMRGYRHAREVNEPQPDSRQGAVSDSRRNALDIPGPLPPVSSWWGRLFARRTLLRLAPRRGIRRVTPLYHLLLPAEGSRIYTPPSPTIVCLVRGGSKFVEDCAKGLKLSAAISKAETGIDEILKRGQSGKDPILGTNDLGWVASRSLSVLKPLEQVTTSSNGTKTDREREEALLHLLRLQQANSRPNSTRPFGNGGGICVASVPAAVFDGLSGRDDQGITKQLSQSGGDSNALRLGDDEQLLPTSNQVARSLGATSTITSAAHRLIAALNRASLDFDGLILLDPDDYRGNGVGQAVVSDLERLVTLEEKLGQEAAERARKAGSGVGAHPWPSSLEPPLAGESDFWQGTLRPGTVRSLRLPLLQTPWRYWSALKRVQRLVYDHGIRTIPAVWIKLESDRNANKDSPLRPSEKDFFNWIEGIPRVYSRVFAKGGFPGENGGGKENLTGKKLEVLIDDQRITIPAWKSPKETKIVFVAGNVGSGKTTLALKLRRKLSEVNLRSRTPTPGQRWEHISPYERHNLFFQLLNLDEPRGMDAEEGNYARFGTNHDVRRELDLLMQETFLIEVASRLTDEISKTRKERDGILVEYWPEMSVEVMGRTALEQPQYSSLVTRLRGWTAALPGHLRSLLSEPIIIMPVEGIDGLVERNAMRKAQRKNEKVDSKFLREVDVALRELLMTGYKIPLEARNSQPLRLWNQQPGVFLSETDPGEWRTLVPLGVSSFAWQQHKVLYPGSVTPMGPRLRPLPVQYVWPSWPPSPQVKSRLGVVKRFVVVVDVNSSFGGGLSRQLARYLS
jgi:hypothetical protein